MPAFRYQAYDVSDPSQSSEGEVDATSEADAAAILIGRGLQPLTVTEVRSGAGRSFDIDVLKRKKVKVQELAFFTRQVATRVESGIMITESLRVAQRGAQSDLLHDAVGTVIADIEQGVPLSEAMRRHPDVFSGLYCSLVQAGETGELGEAMERLADMLETEARNRREVRSAMWYPIGVLSFSALVFVAMMLFVVPAFEGIFEQAGGQLPAPTRMLVTASDLTVRFWYLLPLIAGGAVFGFRRWKATPAGREMWDRLLLQLPLGLGDLFMMVVTARFSRTLSTLVESGVPLMQSLEIAGPTAGNVIVEEGIRDVMRSVGEGMPLAAALKDAEVFPHIAIAMVESGEKSGTLPAMLDRVAGVYEDMVSNQVKSLKSVMEPALIGVIGLIIGTIVVSLYLPMFSVYDEIK